jgi:HAD superfamily phosphatase (TIGR01668 family)
MSFSPVARAKFNKVTDISAEYLSARGIKLLLLDMDNTLAPYGVDVLPQEIIRWARGLQGAGITLAIVSNSHNAFRVASFAETLGVSYVNRAAKPLSGAVKRVIAGSNLAPRETALVGDQVYTDVLAASGAGAFSLLVQPIRLSNPFLAARYALEIPFRLLAQKNDA